MVVHQVCKLSKTLCEQLFVSVDLISKDKYNSLMSKIMRITLTKSRRVRGASHEPADMRSCLTISPHICPVYLADEFSPCVLWPLLIELMVVLFDVFLDGEYGFTSMGR